MPTSTQNNPEVDPREIDTLAWSLAQSNICESDSDALKSDVAQRILGTMLRHLGQQENPEEIHSADLIREIYAAWTKRKPITNEEKDELLSFLIQRETLSLLEEILGKLTFPPRDFPVGVPYETTLLQSLSENETETAARDAIQILIASIRSYPLTVNCLPMEWTRLYEYPALDGTGNLFGFMNEDGKHELIFVDDGERISHFDRRFNNKPAYLGNWMIAASETERMGGLYHLTEAQNPDQSPKLESAYIVNTFESAEWFGNRDNNILKITLSSGKSTLTQISTSPSEQAKRTRLRDILPRYYNAIYMGPHDLVVLEHLDDTDWTTEISVYTLPMLTAGNAMYAESFKLLNRVEDVHANHPGSRSVEFYEWRNICRIWSTKGQSYFTYDPSTKRFTPIRNLDNAAILKDHFFDGNPELIRRNPLDLTLSRFDASRNEVIDLATIPDTMTPLIETIGDIILLHDERATIALWQHDEMLYRLNDDYLVVGEYVYERGWLLGTSLKRTDISLRQPENRWSHLFEIVGMPYAVPKK